MIADWGPADRSGLTPVDGGVAAALGVVAGGTTSGVKASGRPDLALVATDGPAATALVTTTNVVKAPSCLLSERHAADGSARAVVINSGNANLCTAGAYAHNERLAAATARELGVEVDDVLVMSTGVIGVELPVERVEGAIGGLVAGLEEGPAGGGRAAEAILTTDTVAKQVACTVTGADGGTCTVGGMAKGVGMIEPAMATLLAVVTTDAPVGATVLRRILRQAVGATFNRVSIDGDGSTSDSVALLATGRATDPPELGAVTRAVEAVCAELARAVVADGEGASRVAAITVGGAPTEEEAERLARAIATSLLVRAAIHGADPNWGRILMAMGTAGVAFDPGRVGIACGGVTVCRFGVATAFDRGQAAAAMDRDEVEITVDVGSGSASATMLTCDLTPEYVRFNSEYTT